MPEFDTEKPPVATRQDGNTIVLDFGSNFAASEPFLEWLQTEAWHKFGDWYDENSLTVQFAQDVNKRVQELISDLPMGTGSRCHHCHVPIEKVASNEHPRWVARRVQDGMTSRAQCPETDTGHTP
jgi:hypothetical protein